MPLRLTLTEGVLPVGTEAQAVQELTDAMLKAHGLLGNEVMTPNITATVQVLPPSQTFFGGKPAKGIWAEWRTPSFAFSDHGVRQTYFKEATDILERLSNHSQPREHIHINVVHAVDGAWNFNGAAATNEEIIAAFS